MKPKEFLDTLGSTSIEVADSLRKMDIKGTSHVHKCPIFKALTLNTDGKEFVVGPYSYVGYDNEAGERVTLSAPKPVRDFIVEFDRGKHEDLREK